MKNQNLIKFIIIILFFKISTYSLNGQEYGNNWVVSKNRIINFKNCVASIDSTSNSDMAGYEGVSTISDSLGNILFYTNSVYVWNKEHKKMDNGDLILASNTPVGGTLSQVIIIPKPNSSNLYYIITTDVQAQRYSLLFAHTIDISQNNGLGKVISKFDTLSNSTITEQICATYHKNKRDIWLLAHEYGNNTIMAFMVTSTGISKTPVISKVGPPIIFCNSNMNSRGEIKFSPDGKRVAFNGNGVANNDSSNVLTICDFDNNTGRVSNPINLPVSKGEFGLSFSPDNSKLYGSTWKAMGYSINDYNFLYQFDLSSGVPASIINSKYIIDSNQNTYGTLKIAPNGQIYVRYVQSDYIGIIANPNNFGKNCNYKKNGLYVGSKKYEFGLNNYIEYTSYCSDSFHNSSIKNNFNNKPSIFLFPNRIKNHSKLYINTTIKNGIFKLYNSTGKNIFTLNNINGTIVNFDLPYINNGIYHYSLELENKILVRDKIEIVE